MVLIHYNVDLSSLLKYYTIKTHNWRLVYKHIINDNIIKHSNKDLEYVFMG